MLRYLLLVAVFLPALVLAQTPHGVCTAGRPPPAELRVVGCTTQPCTVSQNSIIEAAIDFTAPNGALSLLVDLWLTVFGEHINFPISPENQNGCNFLTAGSCPLAIGAPATFTFFLPLTNIFIGPLTVEVSLLDHTGATAMCLVLSVIIVP